jgi:1-acyl-sn-glycerol-3-phosphate acyltransferase
LTQTLSERPTEPQDQKPPSIRIRHRGPIFHFFWPFTRWAVTSISVILFRIYFDILNRTIVIGRENVPEKPNTLLLPNHQSMIDGFLVGSAVFFPKCLVKPWITPWLPAARENFFANPFMRFFADNWKCIPVNAGRKDFGAMKRMEACLKQGIMIVFPEGTRSRDGGLLPPRSGIGFVMCRTNPVSVPVCMDGMDRCLPIGQFWPRFGKTIYIYYGESVSITEFAGKAPGRENAQAAIKKVFGRVAHLKLVLDRYRRYRRHLLANKPFFYRLYES